MKKIALFLLAVMLLTFIAIAGEVVMQPVESSLIARAGYDAETQTLAVQLATTMDTYYYKEVPQAVYDGFLAAESKGAYYAENIKGKYSEDMAR